MLKKTVQQGRSERRAEAVPSGVRWGSERCENDAGRLFQHPVKGYRQELSIESMAPARLGGEERVEPAVNRSGWRLGWGRSRVVAL